MIAILKPNSDPEKVQQLIDWIHEMGLETHVSVGKSETIIGLVGDTSIVDTDRILSLEIVDKVKRVSEPFKTANRKFHPEDTVIDIHGTKIGGGHFQIIAGPCSIESEEQICEVARRVKAAGAGMLRGGAFKPRTSPYAFQGLRAEGIEYLVEAKELTGLPIVSEIMNIGQLPLFDDVDVIQVGARNMQNFDLLRELGQTKKVIFLKRGMASTIEEFLMSAEYIMAGGNPNVILCERGIRTIETQYTRNTMDISAVPVLRRLTHLPIVVDPSHATGHSYLVKSMAMAAAVAGADGIMVEVHNDPPHALCDGPQSLTPDAFEDVAKAVLEVHKYACR